MSNADASTNLQFKFSTHPKIAELTVGQQVDAD